MTSEDRRRKYNLGQPPRPETPGEFCMNALNRLRLEYDTDIWAPDDPTGELDDEGNFVEDEPFGDGDRRYD